MPAGLLGRATGEPGLTYRLLRSFWRMLAWLLGARLIVEGAELLPFPHAPMTVIAIQMTHNIVSLIKLRVLIDGIAEGPQDARCEAPRQFNLCQPRGNRIEMLLREQQI